MTSVLMGDSHSYEELSVCVEKDLAQRVRLFVVLWAGQGSFGLEVRSSCTPTGGWVRGSFPDLEALSAIPSVLSGTKVSAEI